MQITPIVRDPCGCAITDQSPIVPLSRRDLPSLEAWEDMEIDPAGLPIVWQNDHSCACGQQWSMAQSSRCPDACPWCDNECDPDYSEWIGPEGGQTLWEALPEQPDPSLPVSEAIRCRCGWKGRESDLIEGADNQDGMQSDCLCPACRSDHFLSGFDAAVDPL